MKQIHIDGMNVKSYLTNGIPHLIILYLRGRTRLSLPSKISQIVLISGITFSALKLSITCILKHGSPIHRKVLNDN